MRVKYSGGGGGGVESVHSGWSLSARIDSGVSLCNSFEQSDCVRI